RHLLVELGELTQTQRAPDALPNEGLLVTGQFVSVDPGHGAARWFAGLYGAGQSRAVTHVEIYDLAKSKTMPVADFDTEGGSRGAGGIVSAGEGLDADWWRTAREIRTFIEEQSGIKPVKASSSSSSPRDR
ncbi:MAG: DUF4410 domain-containing protein, partial [Acidobacteria bacterium]|nr:DUF4410 domain-containing protein [Acidobacteriota bacterium]